MMRIALLSFLLPFAHEIFAQDMAVDRFFAECEKIIAQDTLPIPSRKEIIDFLCLLPTADETLKNDLRLFTYDELFDMAEEAVYYVEDRKYIDQLAPEHPLRLVVDGNLDLLISQWGTKIPCDKFGKNQNTLMHWSVIVGHADIFLWLSENSNLASITNARGYTPQRMLEELYAGSLDS